MARAPVFFAASAGIAGTLIGLLFVAISLRPERVIGPEAEDVYSARASLALTAFLNALVVSLFGLIPRFSPGGAATAVAVIGLGIVAAAILRLAPSVRAAELHVRELGFLLGLAIAFGVQLVAAIQLDVDESRMGSLQTICIVVVVCFVLGIQRAWELVGGPRLRLFGALAERRRERDRKDQGE
jgi:4-amino-4-deoxy-L-arabinose transferase-like glycosyltransferase